MNELMTLNINESDIPDPRLMRKLTGKEPIETLGSDGAATPIERLMALVPQIVTEKLRKIIPDDYQIVEVTMSIKVKGNFLVGGIDGDVQLKIKPKSAQSKST